MFFCVTGASMGPYPSRRHKKKPQQLILGLDERWGVSRRGLLTPTKGWARAGGTRFQTAHNQSTVGRSAEGRRCVRHEPAPLPRAGRGCSHSCSSKQQVSLGTDPSTCKDAPVQVVPVRCLLAVFLRLVECSEKNLGVYSLAFKNL